MKRIFQFLHSFPSLYRDIFIIIVAYAIFAIGGSLYWAAIPILTERIFGLSPFLIGLVMAGIGVVYMLTDGPIGVILDYIGYKKGAAIAILCAVVTSLLSITQPSLPVFLVGLVFYALSWNVLTHATSAYILYNVPDRSEGRVFGLYGSLYSFGVFVATFFIGYVSDWDFKNVGWFFLIPSILSLLLVVFFLKPEKRNFNNNLWQALLDYWKGPPQWKRGWQAMKEFSPVSWVTALDGFVGYAFSSTIWLIIPLSLASFANPFLPEGFALGAFEISGIFAVAIGGFLADRYSKKKIFLNLLFLEIFITLALGFSKSFLLFIALAFITMAIDDALGPSIDSMLAVVDEKHDKDGTIYGFMGILTDLGFVVGPIVGSIAFDLFGLRGVFIFLALLLFADWLFAKIFLKNFIEKPGKKPPISTDFHLGGLPKTR